MRLTIGEGATAIAYVITSAYAMITAEVPVYNGTEAAVQFSLYNAILDPEGQCLTTTETLYSLGAGDHCVITDELLRIRDPRQECQGYVVKSSLCVQGQVCDQRVIPITVL